jgi:hypothetical protein
MYQYVRRGGGVEWIGQLGIKKGERSIFGIWIGVKVVKGGFLRIDGKSKI